jgi:hypothetical protein
MPRGAPAVKLAITVDRDVHAKVLKAARKQKLSVSAWMTSAARRQLSLRDGLAAIEEWEREQGELSEGELRAARKRLLRRRVGTGAPKGR